MKTNTPVTQNEIFLPTGRYIVSKTDLKGLITEVNETFIEVSGFSRDELIGQSHNIVRHPDMPPSAFEDLWRTLESGRAWRGIVKNRCKNGDFYWVDAFAVPVRKGGQVIGYMSVRTRLRAIRSSRQRCCTSSSGIVKNLSHRPQGGWGSCNGCI